MTPEELETAASELKQANASSGYASGAIWAAKYGPKLLALARQKEGNDPSRLIGREFGEELIENVRRIAGSVRVNGADRVFLGELSNDGRMLELAAKQLERFLAPVTTIEGEG